MLIKNKVNIFIRGRIFVNVTHARNHTFECNAKNSAIIPVGLLTPDQLFEVRDRYRERVIYVI